MHSSKDVSHHFLAADTKTMRVPVSTFFLHIILRFRIRNSRTDNTVIAIKYSTFPPLHYRSSLKLTLIYKSALKTCVVGKILYSSL